VSATVPVTAAAAVAVAKPVTMPAAPAFPGAGLTYLAITATVLIIVVVMARISGKESFASS